MRGTLLFVGCFAFLLCSFAQGANVTVAKTGGDFSTVQAGIDAAGPGGTVTILDSATYVEDVVVTPTLAGITIRAASGQRPTIQAANTRIEDPYIALAIVPPDRFGFSVWAPCTIEGLNLVNPDTQTNLSLSFGELTACALVIHSPGVVVRDCTISGPLGGFTSGGDWATCLVIAWGPIAAGARFENCEFIGGEYTLVNETFGLYLPGWVVSSVEAVNCHFTSATTNNVVSDAGITTLTSCLSDHSQGNGLSIGGGIAFLEGCDIVDNAGMGVEIAFNDSFALTGDWPNVSATDCFIARNQGTSRDANVRIDEGTLTIDHSIIAEPQNTAAIYMDDNGAASPCILNMNFCDIYAPGQDCFWFDMDVNEHPIQIDIKNSILVGVNGIINNIGPFHPMTVSYSDIDVTDVATSGVTELNNVSITPLYMNTAIGKRHGYRYWNDNLNVGEGGAEIGSQGRYTNPSPLRADNRWSLYN